MLTFLRKYQKFFFILISIVTIASFSFFGTFSNYSNSPDEGSSDPIGKAIDGTLIRERDLKEMKTFLAFGGSRLIQTDLIETGLAAILGERYFDEIRSDFEKRIEKIRQFKPYAHPQAPFINVEDVWRRFAPSLIQKMSQLRQAEISPNAFSLFCRLFLDQAAFPPEVLARILSYQQQQYQWVQPDPNIDPQRLSLFGYRTLEDWFGSTFMDKACLFLIDASKIAEERGYKISLEEARADLLQTALQTLQEEGYQQQTYADAARLLQYQLTAARIDESTAVQIWKKVLLFRRLFNDVGTAVVVDPLTYGQFSAYAGEKVTVNLYRLPKSLRFDTLRSFFKFQTYLEAVSKNGKQQLGQIPLEFSSVDEVEEKAPQLVQSRFYLEVAHVSREDIAQKISLRETWDWEVSDAGWESLGKEFPGVMPNEIVDRKERVKLLEGVDAQLRFKMDEKAREFLVLSSPKRYEEALNQKASEKMWVGIRCSGAMPPFEDIGETEPLLRFLSQAPLEEPLTYIPPNGKAFYRISLIEKPSHKEIVTFEEALKGDALDRLLDQKLDQVYATVRKKDPHPFQTDKGGWKPLRDVQDLVGLKYFVLPFRKDKQGLEEAALHSLKDFLQEALVNLRKEGSASSFIQPTGDPLKDQWILVQDQVTVKRSEHTTFAKEKAFTLAEGDWSEIDLPVNGDLSFFQLVKRETSTDAIKDQMEEGQKILSTDAKRVLMHQILDQICLRQDRNV